MLFLATDAAVETSAMHGWQGAEVAAAGGS